MTLDAASILFPNDAVSKQQAPVTQAAQPVKTPLDDAAIAAATLFPNEGKAPTTQQPTGDDADPASVLFKDDAAEFDATRVEGFFYGFANSAAADGDIERARELHAASESLIANFKEAGTDAKDASEALDIIRERQGDTLGGPLSEERLAEAYDKGMNALLETYADAATLNADLAKAQAFIRDLEKIAPGTMASLEATGAGSDPRLIRAAIKEAKRRGYK